MCSRASSHDVHGLPRFRTNDVLLGTSGVGVHFSVHCGVYLTISPGKYFLLLFGYIGCLKPCIILDRSLTSSERKRSCKRAKSPVRNSIFDLHTFYLHLSRPDFASDVSLRIRSRVLTLSAWSLFVFRHGSHNRIAISPIFASLASKVKPTTVSSLSDITPRGKTRLEIR